MSEVSGVRGVVLGHGAMARGLVDAVRRISGVPDDALVPLSNEGLDQEGICRVLDEALGARPGVIFTDMGMGSCALAARMTCREAGDRAIVSGVNLPMLLDFVFNREKPLAELVPRLVERGRQGVDRLL